MASPATTLTMTTSWLDEPRPSLWDRLSPIEKRSCFQGPLQSSVINKKTTWRATGWVMEHYDEVIVPGIEHCLRIYVKKICGSRRFAGCYYCRLVGEDPISARPNVVIRDPDSALRKRFANVLKEQLWYLDSGFRIHDEPGPLWLTAEASTPGSDHSINSVAGFMPPSLFGREFHVPSIHNSGASKATVAAIIRAYDRDYALTVVHCFGKHDKENNEVILHPRPMQLICSEPDFQQYFQEAQSTYSEVTVGCAQLSREQTHSTEADWSLACELRGPCAFNRFQEDLGLEQLHESNVVPQGTVIILSQGQDHYRRTTASGEVCLISIPGVISLQRVYAIDTNPDPVESEVLGPLRSGSLVISEAGHAFGIVVASAPDLNTTYVMPLSKIFDDISISLRPSAEPKLERPCFAPFMALEKIEAHVSSFDFLRQALRPLETDDDAWDLQTTSCIRLQDQLSSILRRSINHEWHKDPQSSDRTWLHCLQWQLESVLRIDTTGSSGFHMVELARYNLQNTLDYWESTALLRTTFEDGPLQPQSGIGDSSTHALLYLKSMAETDHDSTYSSMHGVNLAPSVKSDARSIYSVKDDMLSVQSVRLGPKRTPGLGSTTLFRRSKILTERNYGLYLRLRSVSTIPSRHEQFEEYLNENVLLTRPEIPQHAMQGLRTLLEDFLRATKGPNTSASFSDSLKTFRETFSTTLPEFGAFTLTDADLQTERIKAAGSNENTLVRTYMMSVIDRWRLDFKFSFDCGSFWTLGEDFILPIRKLDTSWQSLPSLPQLMPSLSISFQKKNLVDTRIQIFDRYITRDLRSCCNPTQSHNHLFPFFFIEPKRDDLAWDLSSYRSLRAASQSLYNVYNCMRAAGDVSRFKHVRMFSIVLNAKRFILRIHWATESSSSSDRGLTFSFENTIDRSSYNAHELSLVIRNILKGYASTTLFSILKETFTDLTLSSIRAEMGSADVGEMLRQHPDVADLVKRNVDSKPEEDLAQGHHKERGRERSPADTSLAEAAHKRSRRASAGPSDSSSVDM